jgi:aldehyde:ferredoxin oxidoreductase
MYEVGCSSLQASRLASLGLNEPQPAGTMNQEKIRFAYLTELLYSALDSYCLCQFVWGAAWVLYGPQETAEMLSAASGWDISVDEILLVGERRLNMMRMFNARMGLDRSADRLPRKFFKPLEGEGPTAGVALDEGELEIQKDTYYQIAGWDIPTGVPGLNKLADLGIEWAV